MNQPDVVGVGRAFQELVDAGVPQWPGVFRNATITYTANHCVAWQWRAEFGYTVLAWDVMWERWRRTNYVYDSLTEPTVSCGYVQEQVLAPLLSETWRKFVAAPRPIDCHPLYKEVPVFGKVWTMDEDTPLDVKRLAE